MARALAGEGEIILFSDGRSTAGRVTVEKFHVPVHTFPLGPVGGVDVSIRAIDAPASAPTGTSIQIRISVASTGPWRGDLVAGDDRRPLEFTGPGLQDVVINRTMAADDLNLAVRVGAADPCPENDAATVKVWRETRSLRVLIESDRPRRLSRAPVDDDGGADLAVAAGGVVILQRLPRTRLGLTSTGWRGWCATAAPSLVMPGGRGLRARRLERNARQQCFPGRSPTTSRPWSSSWIAQGRGRAAGRIRSYRGASAVRRSLEMMHDDDEAALVTFAASAELRCPPVAGRERGRVAALLSGVSAEGPTVLKEALAVAGSAAKSSKAGRRHLVIVTDGKSVGEEAELKNAARLLREDNIGMTIVRTGGASTPALAILREAGAVEIDGSDFARLDERVAEALARSRDLTMIPTHGLSFSGLQGAPRPALLNRCRSSRGGDPGARGRRARPLVVRPAGRQGRGVDFLLRQGLGGRVVRLAGRGGRHRADGGGRGAARGRPARDGVGPLRGRPARDRRRDPGTERRDSLDVTVDGAAVALARRGENTYAKTLRHMRTPRPSGSRADRGRRPAAHAPEFDDVGPDLNRSRPCRRRPEGRGWRRPATWPPCPAAPSEPRSARGGLLAAALALFLIDVAMSLLWRH